MTLYIVTTDKDYDYQFKNLDSALTFWLKESRMGNEPVIYVTTKKDYCFGYGSNWRILK